MILHFCLILLNQWLFTNFCLILRCSTTTKPGSAAQLTCSANFSCPVCVKKHFQNQIFPTPNNYPILFPFSIELAIKVTLSVRAPQAGSTPSEPPPINHHLQCFTELLCGQRSLAGQNARTCVKNHPGGTSGTSSCYSYSWLTATTVLWLLLIWFIDLLHRPIAASQVNFAIFFKTIWVVIGCGDSRSPRRSRQQPQLQRILNLFSAPRESTWTGFGGKIILSAACKTGGSPAGLYCSLALLALAAHHKFVRNIASQLTARARIQERDDMATNLSCPPACWSESVGGWWVRAIWRPHCTTWSVWSLPPPRVWSVRPVVDTYRAHRIMWHQGAGPQKAHVVILSGLHQQHRVSLQYKLPDGGRMKHILWSLTEAAAPDWGAGRRWSSGAAVLNTLQFQCSVMEL